MTIEDAFDIMVLAARRFDVIEDDESAKDFMSAAIQFAEIAKPKEEIVIGKLAHWYAMQPREEKNAVQSESSNSAKERGAGSAMPQ